MQHRHLAHEQYTSEPIRDVHFDDEHMRVDLADCRIMSVPLRWIPTVCHASPEVRTKYEFSRSRTMIIWDPAKCAINAEIRITDYLGPVERLS